MHETPVSGPVRVLGFLWIMLFGTRELLFHRANTQMQHAATTGRHVAHLQHMHTPTHAQSSV